MFSHHPVCRCGSVRMDHELRMFPLTWTASCHACGAEILRCDLKLDKPLATKSNPSVRVGNGPWVDRDGNYHSGA